MTVHKRCLELFVGQVLCVGLWKRLAELLINLHLMLNS